MSDVNEKKIYVEPLLTTTADKYAEELTNKMATLIDIEEKDKKLIEAMILIEKDAFIESVKKIIGKNLLDVEKIVKFVNLANNCCVEVDKVQEIIAEDAETIKTKLADYLVENIPLTKRKTSAQDMRELMNELDITKIITKDNINTEPKEKWYSKFLKKIKSLFK